MKIITPALVDIGSYCLLGTYHVPGAVLCDYGTVPPNCHSHPVLPVL